MQLDQLQVVLRARTPWEAMDLGLTMARAWARPLWAGWAASTLLPWALIWAALWDHPGWALLLCWWLKPVWDHAALHVVSRALFGGSTGLRDTLRAVAHHAPRDLLGKLLWRRLAPWRTLVAPVTQLEGLKGGAARRRRAVLGRGLGTHAGWLTAIGVGLELVVAMGLVGTALLLLPDEPRFSVDVLWDDLTLGEPPWWMRVGLPLVAWSAMAAVEPLVVAAGFALYINRRTLLEGWDVELTFRRLAARLSRLGRAAGAALLALGLALGAPAARAEGPPAPDDAVVDQAVDEVLADPLFGEPRMESRWELRDYEWLDWFKWDSGPRETSALPGLGGALEVLLWVAFGALVVGALMAVISRLGRDPAPPDAALAPASAVRGEAGPAAPPAPPADPPAAARRLWAAGQRDQALAVLYGAAVAWLVDDVGVLVPEGATEGEVLRLARRAVKGEPIAVFGRVTRAWQQTAYAHRAVETDEFEGLCAAWPLLRGGAA